jgi:hypothetical protein
MALERISFIGDVSKDWHGKLETSEETVEFFFTEMFSQQRFQAWKCREN